MIHGSVRAGDLEVVAICDLVADFPTPLRTTFPDVPEEEWPAFRERYPDAFGGDDVWLAHDHCYLIRGGGRTILVDTGVGPLGPGIAGIHRSNGLPDALEASGVAPEDVDTVVFTHLHFDHVGWNRVPDENRARFGKARHVIHRADWDVFARGADPFSTAAFQASVLPLEKEGLVELVDGALELMPGVAVEPAPGHTLGHVVVTVTSGDERVVVAGDLVNHPAQLAEPAWREIGDMDLDAAASSRRKLFGDGPGDATVFAPAHFPEPFGHVSKDRGRFVWSPAG